MVLWLYKHFEKSKLSESQKISSVKHQWIYFSLMSLPILIPFTYALISQPIKNIGDLNFNFMKNSFFWIIYGFLSSSIALVGQILLLWEIINNKVILAVFGWTKSLLIFSTINFRKKILESYHEIENPISLLTMPIPFILLIYLLWLMFKISFNNFMNLF